MINKKYILANEYSIGTIKKDIIGNIFKVIVLGTDIKLFQNIKNNKITQCILTNIN